MELTADMLRAAAQELGQQKRDLIASRQSSFLAAVRAIPGVRSAVLVVRPCSQVMLLITGGNPPWGLKTTLSTSGFSARNTDYLDGHLAELRATIAGYQEHHPLTEPK